MTIEKLRELMCVPADADNIKDRFEEIAEIIKNCCVIKFKGERFRILDFEFYFYNKEHRDISVHPRKSEALCWYFNDFGGILIRQIQCISDEDKTLYDGPWKVAELFRAFNATSQMQTNPVLEIKPLDPIPFMKPFERYHLLGSYKGSDKEMAKAKADNNLKASFTGYSESDKSFLEEKLEDFSKCEYRYCWVKTN